MAHDRLHAFSSEAKANGVAYTVMPDGTVLAHGVRIGLARERRCDVHFDGASYVVFDNCPVPTLLDAIRLVHKSWKEHIECLGG